MGESDNKEYNRKWMKRFHDHRDSEDYYSTESLHLHAKVIANHHNRLMELAYFIAEQYDPMDCLHEVAEYIDTVETVTILSNK